MKGLVLLGGKGSRLEPLTNYINKNQIPIGNKILCEHAIETLIYSGIKEIILSSDKEFIFELASKYNTLFPDITFIPILGNSTGLADRILLCREQLKGDSFVVAFGDVLFEKKESLKKYIETYQQGNFASMILLGPAEFPPRHATPFFDGEKVTKIVEKCKDYPHNLVVLGWDIFPAIALEYLDTLKPSARGELEITDLRNLMIEHHSMGHFTLDGWWLDAGIPKDLLRANRLVLERDFPETLTAINRAQVHSSQLTLVTLGDDVHIDSCTITNSIIFGNCHLEDETIENTIRYNDIVLTDSV